MNMEAQTYQWSKKLCLTFELGRASPAFRSIAGTNIGIGSQAIVMSGTEKQKKQIPYQNLLLES